MQEIYSMLMASALLGGSSGGGTGASTKCLYYNENDNLIYADSEFTTEFTPQMAFSELTTGDHALVINPGSGNYPAQYEWHDEDAFSIICPVYSANFIFLGQCGGPDDEHFNISVSPMSKNAYMINIYQDDDTGEYQLSDDVTVSEVLQGLGESEMSALAYVVSNSSLGYWSVVTPLRASIDQSSHLIYLFGDMTFMDIGGQKEKLLKISISTTKYTCSIAVMDKHLVIDVDVDNDEQEINVRSTYSDINNSLSKFTEADMRIFLQPEGYTISAPASIERQGVDYIYYRADFSLTYFSSRIEVTVDIINKTVSVDFC